MRLPPSADSGGTIGDGHDGVLAGLTAWLPVRDAAGRQCAASAGGHQGPAGEERLVLRAGKAGLRARDEADVAVLHAELYEDIATRMRADSRPWRPIPAGSAASPYAVGEPRDDMAVFSVVELAGGELAGEALLWAIDLHNRTAHLGVSLRPAFRGRGLGADVVSALCEYGFAVRGLRRLQVDTLADNTAMIRAAERAGFVPEGRLRQAAWVSGEFADEVILGLLATDWGSGGDRPAGLSEIPGQAKPAT